jgi:hypothetical protein
MIRRRTGNSIIISKVANGWTVELPIVYDDQDNEIATGIQEGMGQMMPFIKEAIKEMHKDPLLAKLQEDAEEENPEETPEREPAEKIGTQPNYYVFKTMEEVQFFLSEEFPD